jgi:uncharacterized protein YbcV (DUF1398 family)
VRESLHFTSQNFKQNLRKNNYINFLSEISESNNVDEMRNICNNIIEMIISEENLTKIESNQNFNSKSVKSFSSSNMINPRQ